jgi:hypothetical protein
VLNAGEIGGIAGGGAVIVLGSGWFLSAIVRQRRRLRRTLRDPDPAARVAALEAIQNRGVYSYLDALIERALVEDDPRVQETLAGIAIAEQWDPSSDRRLLQLKGWAERLSVPPKAETTIPGTRPDPPSTSTSSEPTQASPFELGPELQASAHAETEVPEPPADLAEPPVRGQDEVEAWLVPDPWAGKPFEESANGLVRETEPANAPRPESGGAAKAEQSAIDLLREAGYGVEKPAVQPEATPAAATPAAAPPTKAVELRGALREVLTQRIITATILEEAARRMRAENERIESTLSSEED